MGAPYVISFQTQTPGQENIESLRAKVLLMQQQYQTASTEVRKSVKAIDDANRESAKAAAEGNASRAASQQAAANTERAALEGLIAKQREVKSQLDQLVNANRQFSASTLEARAAVQALNGNFGTMAAGRWLAQMQELAPVLHGIFMVAGPLAFLDVIGRLVEKFDPVVQGEKDIAEQNKKLADSYAETTKEVQRYIDAKAKASLSPEAYKRYQAEETRGDIGEDKRLIESLKQQAAGLVGGKPKPPSGLDLLLGPGTSFDDTGKLNDINDQKKELENEIRVLTEKAQADEAQADADKKKAAGEAAKKAAEERKRAQEKATALQNHVDEYKKSAANYDLGPVSLAIQKRDEMLATPGLTGKEKATINEAGAQEIARALAKLEDEDARRRPLTFKDEHDKILSAGGTGVEKENSESARTILRDMAKALNELHESMRRVDSATFSGMRDDTAQKIRLAGIGAKPDDQLSLAKQARDLRLDEIAKERETIELHKTAYDMDVENARLARESNDATLDYLEKVAQYAARQRDAFEKTAGSLFDALASRRPGAITDLLREQVLGIGKKITQDLAGKLYQAIPAGTLKSGIGILTGAQDPLKVSATALDTSAAKLSAAADHLSGVGGGNSISGGAGISSAAGTAASAASGSSDDTITDITSDTVFPAGSPITSSSSISKIASIAAIAGGAVVAAQGFSKGGASGALQGVGGLAGMAAGILPLAGVTGPAAPIVAGAGIALSLLGSFLNSPQRRANQINNELAQAQYIAPQAMNVTQTSNGTFADFDARGNLRTSNFSPYPTERQGFVWEQTHGLFGGPPTYYNVPGGQTGQFGAPVTVVNHNYSPGAIQAIDTQSFAEAMDRNHMAIGNAAGKAMQNGHGTLTTEVQRAAHP